MSLQRELDSFDETTPDFERPMPWSGVTPGLALAKVEREADAIVAALYGLPDDGIAEPGWKGHVLMPMSWLRRRAIKKRRCPPSDSLSDLSRSELARRWISYAVDWNWAGGAARRPFLELSPLDPHLLLRIRNRLIG